MRTVALSFLCVLITISAFSQANSTNNSGGLEFYIHEEVGNYDGEVEKQIITLWKDYLNEGDFQNPKSPYWSFQNMKIPDENFWAIGINTLKKRKYKVQCKIIGVFQVENGYWSLISSFSHVDENGLSHLDVISSVYAKEFDGKYLLISSAEYLKTVFEHHKVGTIDYYVHPFHTFQIEEANTMNSYNLELSKEFGIPPLEFDYFVASNARDICRTWGYEYMNRMYNASGKGGVASWRNMTIYSGNNSSYYPHELVHLYTFKLVPQDTHFWIGEGIATFYAGTATYSFDGHMEKLKAFLKDNPEYDLSDIKKLNTTIPNGEYASDFRYVIGGLLMRKVYQKEGVEGFIEALKYGTTDEDFYRMLKDKLNISPETFDSYVKAEAAAYSKN